MNIVWLHAMLKEQKVHHNLSSMMINGNLVTNRKSIRDQKTNKKTIKNNFGLIKKLNCEKCVSYHLITCKKFVKSLTISN